jgi:hypothetical protein
MLQDSLLVASDGNPGDVLTKLVSNSEDSMLHEAEVFGKDLETAANAGEHPWTVENGTMSTLLLYNQSDSPQWFNVQISAGKTVWGKSYQLQPQQTEAVVINDLIKTAAQDNHGVAFPSDIWSGQAGWSVPQKNAGQGRLMQSNRDHAMARNFSCSNTVEVCQAQIDNPDSFFLLGQTVDFGQISFGVCYQECSGTPVGSGEQGYSYSWYTENSKVASISGSSQNQSVSLYGSGVGGTMIEAFVTDPYCSIQAEPSQPANVGPRSPLQRNRRHRNDAGRCRWPANPPASFVLTSLRSDRYEPKLVGAGHNCRGLQSIYERGQHRSHKFLRAIHHILLDHRSEQRHRNLHRKSQQRIEGICKHGL